MKLQGVRPAIALNPWWATTQTTRNTIPKPDLSVMKMTMVSETGAPSASIPLHCSRNDSCYRRVYSSNSLGSFFAALQGKLITSIPCVLCSLSIESAQNSKKAAGRNSVFSADINAVFNEYSRRNKQLCEETINVLLGFSSPSCFLCWCRNGARDQIEQSISNTEVENHSRNLKKAATDISTHIVGPLLLPYAYSNLSQREAEALSQFMYSPMEELAKTNLAAVEEAIALGTSVKTMPLISISKSFSLSTKVPKHRQMRVRSRKQIMKVAYKNYADGLEKQKVSRDSLSTITCV